MKIIPFGDRILVKRKVIGEKLGREGLIVAAAETAERPTDLAVVMHVPDNTFCDQELMISSEDIIKNLTKKASEGDSDCLIALLRFNEYLKIKSIQPGDEVMISKYVGTEFHEKGSGQDLTLVKGEDIIGKVLRQVKTKIEDLRAIGAV